jgi:hypothetical protein
VDGRHLHVEEPQVHRQPAAMMNVELIASQAGQEQPGDVGDVTTRISCETAMLARTLADIDARARTVADRLASSDACRCEIIDGRSTIGVAPSPSA